MCRVIFAVQENSLEQHHKDSVDDEASEESNEHEGSDDTMIVLKCVKSMGSI